LITYGIQLQNQSLKKSVPAGVTAKSVIENFIKAIGGLQAVNAVKKQCNER
jgi:hypothetical protein